jgi:thioester reductase-like protein
VASDLILITGFPGFIGKRLVQALTDARPKAKLACLVEPRLVESATEAAAAIRGKGIKVIPGDISARDLGLAAADRERLVEEMTQAYHLAAIYDLAVPIEVAQRVNVDGTGNVLELCSAAKRFERLDYVSTAYVAGLRTGVIYEHELSVGQNHKNHYESTKFQAEVWVRQEAKRIPTATYRPAIVVGDSRTGETQKFDGPYYILRTISKAVERHLPIMQFGQSGANFNAVPVDFIVDSLVAGGQDPKAIGGTFHLVDPEPVTAGELLGHLAREYADKEPGIRIPPRMVETLLRSRRMREYYGGAPRESIRYLNHPQRFDTRQAGDMLGRAGVRCPRFEEYVGAMVRFYREHEDDPAFAPAAKL